MKKAGVEEIREAWLALAADPCALAAKLIELSGNAEDEMVRVRIARAILDRVGLRRGVDVGLYATSLVDVQPSPPPRSAVDIVIERLATLRASKEQAASHARHIEEAAG